MYLSSSQNAIACFFDRTGKKGVPENWSGVVEMLLNKFETGIFF